MIIHLSPSIDYVYDVVKKNDSHVTTGIIITCGLHLWLPH